MAIIYLFSNHGACFHAGSTLTLVQLMLDVVLSALTLLIVQFFLELSYHGVSYGPSFHNMLGTGIQLTLVVMILKAFMDTRYSFGKSNRVVILGNCTWEYMIYVH